MAANFTHGVTIYIEKDCNCNIIVIISFWYGLAFIVKKKLKSKVYKLGKGKLYD